MKIWYQSTVEIENYHNYRESLLRHFARVGDAGTEVTLRGTPAGTWGGLAPSDIMQSSYAYHVVLSNILFEHARQAEAEGYDAFVLGSFTEPWLRELRSAVDIPVVSLPESAILVACTVAPKIALITMNTENDWFLRNIVASHQLGGRISGVYVIEPRLDELGVNRLFTDPTGFLERFRKMAQRAVAEHADAVIPAEGLVAEVVTANGITDIDGAPVIDPIACAIAFAEMAVKLRKKTGLHAGRRWHYAKASQETMRFIDGKASTVA